MKRLVLCLLIALGATVGQSCCCLCTCSRSAGCQTDVAGPELTGNYATPYLYSSTTGKTYADPMYYHAQAALQRWHKIRFEGIPASAARKQYTEVKAESR